MKFYYLLFIIFFFGLTAYPSNNSKKLIYDGNEEYDNSNYIEAINKYTEALNLDPSSEIAQFNLATALVVLGTETNDTVKINLAEDKFQSLVRSNSKSISKKSNFDLGNIAYNKRDYESSIEYYKKVLRIDPSDDLARKYLRMAQLKLKSNQSEQNKDDKKENDEKQQENKDDNNENKEKQQNDNNQHDKSDKQDQQQQNESQQQSTPNQLNSENLLKSIEEKEQQTLMKLNERKNEAIRREHEAGRANTDKPW